ncbi:MAG: PQQ-binding-like beta-propeller repeat protein [Acidimicrobiales bacterium]
MRGYRRWPSMTKWLVLLALCAGSTMWPTPAGAAGAPRPAVVTSSTDWPAYLDGPSHTSDNVADSNITPANAGSLHQIWHFEPAKPTMSGQPAGLQASPVVSGGVIYIGARTGVFYAINESTGKQLWSQFIGFRPHHTCSAQGIISTATVATDPSTGMQVVYVASPDGNLYAMNAANGSVVWKSVIAIPSATQSDYFDWSSPTVANGLIYVWISSQCDHPLVRAGEIAFDQATGNRLATYYAVPQGIIGASIWSSAAVLGDGSIVVTTGNERQKQLVGDDYSLVHLNGQTMTKIDSWQVPSAQLPGSDNDFGGSPTPFVGSIDGAPTPLVGACNKNGYYYAVRQSDFAAGPVWSLDVSLPFPTDPNQPGQCDAAAAWYGSSLYIGGNGTTINGTSVVGSISRVDPSTGVPIWRTGLPGEVIGSPTLNGAGVLAVPMMGSKTSGDGVAILDASTGSVLTTIPASSPVFAQPVFANGMLFIATSGASGLRAFAPN